MSKPLENIVVLDLTRVLAGPYCTMILNNLGAEIIKVERPGIGDDARKFGPFKQNESAYFASLNYGKKSIELNLKKDEDLNKFKSLVEKADVLVENFRPGTMEKLGLSYKKLKKINTQLVYASISGFGQTGPDAKKPAYDMIVQGRGGLMSITGEPGGPPIRVGASIGDITAGLYGAIGILTALFQRKETCEGQEIDVAMLDCQISILENAIARFITTGENPKPLGTKHPSIAPFQAFESKNDWIIIAAGNNNIWERLCNALGIEQLINDPRFKTNDERCKNIDLLEQLITQETIKYCKEDLLELLKEHNVPCTSINSISDLFEDDQIKARNMIKEMDSNKIGGFKVSGNPIKMGSFKEKGKVDEFPDVGEHTQEVLNKFLKEEK